MRASRWLLLVILVLIATVAYVVHKRSSGLKVEPHAAEEIEKAKRR